MKGRTFSGVGKWQRVHAEQGGAGGLRGTWQLHFQHCTLARADVQFGIHRGICLDGMNGFDTGDGERQAAFLQNVGPIQLFSSCQLRPSFSMEIGRDRIPIGIFRDPDFYKKKFRDLDRGYSGNSDRDPVRNAPVRSLMSIAPFLPSL